MSSSVINRSDYALSLSASGAIPISQGPGAFPLYDSRFCWDAANRRHTLTGQAAGAGGDRWRLQTSGGSNLARWDADGVLVQDLTVNTSGFLGKTIPQADAQPVTYNRAIDTSQTGAPSGQGNSVHSDGWNTGPGGQRINLLHPTFRIGKEFNYWTGSEYWMEGHLFAYIDPTTGNETRPYTMLVNKSNNYDTIATFQGASWYWVNRSASTQYAALVNSAAGDAFFTVLGKNGTDNNGYAMQLISNGGATQDVLSIGRLAGSNNQIKLQGAGAVALQINADAGRALFHSTPTTLSVYSPGVGGSMTLLTDTLSLVNRASQRFGLRYTDDGAAKIAFLGAAPVARQTMGVATAGAAYTSTEQNMLQTVWNVLRTFGLGT